MNHHGRTTWLFALALGLACAQPAAAYPAEDRPTDGPVPMPTLGGKQFWADVLFFHQWRIQRNVLTGHHRLLDGRNLRYRSGTYESCREQLDRIRREEHLPPMRGTMVLVLHGLFRSHSSMDPLCDYLGKQGGYTVCNVEYPSTRADVAEHARTLASIVEHLDGIEEIHFVGHSLGNIVVRHYLATAAGEGPRLPDPRIRRFVMLAPPNHGSEIAAALADNELFAAVAGKPGRQLGAEWPWLEMKLAAPPCQFAIIAGGLGNETGFNPRLVGDDDGTITVAGTRLDGARDFLLVPVLHSVIMFDRRVQEQTLQFLRNGRFSTDGQ
ncbi:MAG: alpha/beta fold hydrolase [Pirellulales bacterium]|nr:alpha/beta fold hydrolase [Pirellulales bacterium]